MGKYLLLERLASGGMGEVYRAVAEGERGFKKQLAVKRILAGSHEDEGLRQLFEAEANLCSHLNHPNIVHIYDFACFEDSYLLAMEYIDGKNLWQVFGKSWRRGAPLPIPFVLHVIGQVCLGLDYAHRHHETFSGSPLHIIHRDISPNNIMVSYDGTAKIVDFGVAKARNRMATRTGTIRGKLGYLSPEQAAGEKLDCRTDIFSLGIVLFELLSGRELFRDESEARLLKLVQECRLPSLSHLNPSVLPELEVIVLKALARDREDRYQTAELLYHDLHQLSLAVYSDFRVQDVAAFIRKLFAEEIAKERAVSYEFLGQVESLPPELTLEVPESPSKRSTPVPFSEDRLGTTFWARRRVFSHEFSFVHHMQKNWWTLLLFAAVILLPYYLLRRSSPAAVRQIQPRPRELTAESPRLAPSSAAAARPSDRVGTVELMLSQDAELYVGDERLAQAKAGYLIRVSLPVGENRKIRFVNRQLGIDTVREFNVDPEHPYAQKIDLQPNQ